MKGTVTVKTLLGSGLTFKDIELRGKARGSDLLEKVVEFAGIREVKSRKYIFPPAASWPNISQIQSLKLSPINIF